MVLDAVQVTLGNPLAQLVVVEDQLVEVGAPEPGDVPLEGAGVRLAAGAQRPVAGEAALRDRELGPLRRALLVGEHLPGRRPQVRDEVLELRIRNEAPICRHAQPRRLHLGDVVGIFEAALRRPVQHVLAQIVGALHVHHLRLLGECRDLTLLAARVVHAAAASGPVAREATFLHGDAMAPRRRRLLRGEQDVPHVRVGDPRSLHHDDRDESRDQRTCPGPRQSSCLLLDPTFTVHDDPHMTPRRFYHSRARVLMRCLVVLGSTVVWAAVRAQPLSDLLPAVAEAARAPRPLRADVRIARDGAAAGDAILLARGRRVYLETRSGTRALLSPGKVVVVGRGGRLARAAPGASLDGTDVLLEDLEPFGVRSLSTPQVSDETPARVVVTAAPSPPSAYVLVVLTIDRERDTITQTKYYRDSISNLVKMRRDDEF